MHNSVLIKGKKITRIATQYVVRVAFMSALLTAFKFALSFVPNVEVVTLMIIIYGSCFGILYALPATLIFCAVEIAIYGVASWVLLYFIYWPLLSVLSSLLLKGKRMWLALILGVVGSAFFGFLSACCDTLFALPNLQPQDVSRYFVAYYLRGITFDAIHMASSAATVALLYKPIVSACAKIMPRTVACRGVPRKIVNIEHYYDPKSDGIEE